MRVPTHNHTAGSYTTRSTSIPHVHHVHGAPVGAHFSMQAWHNTPSSLYHRRPAVLASHGSVHLPCSMRARFVARLHALVVVLVATAARRTENNNAMFDFYKCACLCLHTIIQLHAHHTFTMCTVHPSERTSRCRLGTTPSLPSIKETRARVVAATLTPAAVPEPGPR